MNRICPADSFIFAFATASLLLLVAAPATAYNPPVDTAGPLTVRIEGPQEVTETGVPLPVRVVLENKGDQPLQGTLRLELIDRWQAEPAAAVAFSVAAKATVTRDFTITAGEGTYSAHYPIHAFAQFTFGGEPFRAHPILILETKLSAPARQALPLAWKPKRIAPASRLALWRMSVRQTVVAVFGQEPLTMPVGWQGSEPRSHAGLGLRQETLDNDTRSVIAMHPPWFDGLVGTLLVEYPLELPQDTPLTLHFANAMAPGGQSDGVTFRVRALPIDAPRGQLGPVLFERHTDSKTWLDGQADLSRLAGQTVRLQLESHPGPNNNNTGWDQSYWAEPILTAGTPAEPPPFPPQDDAGSRQLGAVGSAADRYDVRVWPGRRGLLDAVVGFSRGKASLAFRGFEVSVLGGRIDDSLSPILLQETVEEACDDGLQIRHRFQSDEGPFDLVGRLTTGDGVLRAGFHLENAPPDRPWRSVYLEELAAGPWSQSAKQLYAGAGNVIRDPGSFRLGFDGHRLSTSAVGVDFAGSFSLVEATDSPPMHLEVRASERHYSLHTAHASTISFVPAENVWEAVKTWRRANGLKAAGGVPQAAGRFVFDLWGGRYGESAQALEEAFRYGLTDAMVVWHNWQRWGYDYRLPEIYPPNPQLGTLDEMQQLIKTCKQAGVPIALHDNYIDYYPDAEGFSYEKQIAFGQDGTPVKAWLNEGRGARS